MLTCPTHTEQLHVLCDGERRGVPGVGPTLRWGCCCGLHVCKWRLLEAAGAGRALHQGLLAAAYLSAICCSVGTAGAPWGCGALSGANTAARKLLVGPGAGAVLAG